VLCVLQSLVMVCSANFCVSNKNLCNVHMYVYINKYICAYTYTCSKNVFIYVYICIYVYVCAGYLRTHLLSSLSTCEGKVNEFFRLKSFNSTLPLSARYVHADNVYVWHMSMRVCVCVCVCACVCVCVRVCVRGLGERYRGKKVLECAQMCMYSRP